MAEIRSNPVMEIDVNTPVGFQPEFVEEDEQDPQLKEPGTGDEDQEEEDHTGGDDPSRNFYVEPPSYSSEEDEDEEEEEEEEEDEEGFDGRSSASILAESFKEIGGLPDDFEVTDDLTGHNLLTALDKSRENAARERLETEYREKYGEELLRYVDYLRQGGNPQVITDTSKLSSLEIDSEEESSISNRKELILAMYKDKGLGEKRAERLYQDLADEGEDLEEAKESKRYFKEKMAEEIQQAQEVDEYQRRQQEENLAKLNDQIRSTIRKRRIGDTEISEQEASNLERYMFDPTQIIDVPSGDTIKKARVSQYYKDYLEFFNSTENLVRLARFIQNKGQMTIEEEEIERKINQKLVDKLNKPERGAGRKKRKRSRNAYLDYGNPVAEFDL